jgi:hypothetical protein
MLSEAWTLRDNVTVADALYVVLARHVGAELARSTPSWRSRRPSVLPYESFEVPAATR